MREEEEVGERGVGVLVLVDIVVGEDEGVLVVMEP